jgi:hypothetical protein
MSSRSETTAHERPVSAAIRRPTINAAIVAAANASK